MNRISSVLTIGFLLSFTACNGDESPSGSDTANTTNMSTTNDTTPMTTDSGMATTTPGTSGQDTDSTMTTGGSDPGSTGGDPGSTGGDPGSTGMGESSGSAGSGESSGGAGMMCEPDPADPACDACVKAMCCDEVEACASDTNCTCFRDCAAMNPGQAGAIACAGECNISVTDLLSPATVTGALVSCIQDSCPKCV